MKRIACAVLALMLVMMAVPVLAEQEGVRWTYPVSLTAIRSDYAILVNALDDGAHMLDSSWKPSPIVKVTGVKRATSAAIQMQETAANALKDMFGAAANVMEYTYTTSSGAQKTVTFSTGMTLYLKSGYRSYQTQKTVYANHLESTGGKDDGYVQKPGSSEHQTGYCADILNQDWAGKTKMNSDFQWTPEAQWMKENCASFGFILRYPQDGESETGIAFEPWHFRYVGEEIATYIMKNGMTLEAFTAEAQQAVADFVAAGGSVEDQLAYEYLHSSGIPESQILEETDEEGDHEISIEY